MEYLNNYPLCLYFGDGTFGYPSKVRTRRVRAIRVF